MESLAVATPPLEIETAPAPTASVIWLHGLGADGHDFEPVVPELKLPRDVPVRFVFPHAPLRAVTINAGIVMRAWYDIYPAADGFHENPDHVHEAERIMHVFIRRELERGISAVRMVLAGFSQGGAIALHTGLRYPQRLAGILALSSYLPLQESLSQERSDAGKDAPIFMAHGEYDPLIPLSRGLESRDFLRQQGYRIDWQAYPIGHNVGPAEIADIARWLITILRQRDPIGH